MTQTRFDAFLHRVYQATGMASQNDLAAALEVNRSAITQARRKNAIPAKWALGLFRRYGLNPEWVEHGTGPTFVRPSTPEEPDFAKVPKVRARLCAGDGSFEVGGEIEGYYAFQTRWLSGRGNADQMVLLDIFGNSMEPELRAGDTVLVDRSQKEILAGAVYAVGIDDTIMVKRLEKHPRKLVAIFLLRGKGAPAPVRRSPAEGKKGRVGPRGPDRPGMPAGSHPAAHPPAVQPAGGRQACGLGAQNRGRGQAALFEGRGQPSRPAAAGRVLGRGGCPPAAGVDGGGRRGRRDFRRNRDGGRGRSQGTVCKII